MLIRQLEKFNTKIKSNNYYFFCLLILISYNYYILYNYLLDKNYNILIFFFIYLFILYSYLNIFSYFIVLITLYILKLLNIDNYIKNIYIIENNESINACRQGGPHARSYIRKKKREYRARKNYSSGLGTGLEPEETLKERIEASVDAKANTQREIAETTESSGPPDPAYQYIVAHMPDCGKEMLALKSLPQIP